MFKKWVLNIFIAPLTIAKVSARVYAKTPEKRKKVWPYAISAVGTFSLFIIFHLAELVVPGCWAMAWFFYLCFTCQVTATRIKTREIYDIIGNASEDFFAAMILYPNVATQLDLTTESLSEEDNEEENSRNKSNERTDVEKMQHENGSFAHSMNEIDET